MKRVLKTAAAIAGAGALFYTARAGRAALFEERSIESKIVEDLIKVFNFDLEEVDAKMLAKNFKENRKEHKIRENLLRSKAEAYWDAGMKVFRILPGKKTSTRRVLYIHGGGYIHQPSPFHWLFIDQMVQETGLEFIVPIYPKTPEFSYESAYDAISELYGNLLDEGEEEIILVGDSAGGGLAIGFTQWLATENMTLPRGLIIISPWLDVTLEHHEMEQYAKYDPMLRPEHLKKIGRLWAGNADRSYYKVSPINGPLTGLPKIYLFVGEREICLPDSREFAAKLEAAGAPYEYYEYPMMNHVFPQYPIREGARARRQIKEILQSLA
ncbi:alpha/beta hydrolase [Lacicoccus alkaliphilus]|uniref:Acetyl esterase/lipase n=1 Tax=Lacicoccus alkaliphilus DSM 16010 TaxID=1123231 RepID=A0A1M7IVQ7_9BACL|nr:alpha/beta hydrolase [Salinicoccus alkaliphilus]SHM44427.1 Acetyl esterase/lipase [Salinicoccus alkaliphilus DSM 16010]